MTPEQMRRKAEKYADPDLYWMTAAEFERQGKEYAAEAMRRRARHYQDLQCAISIPSGALITATQATR